MVLKKCPKCPRKFRKRSTFLKHFRKAHGGKGATWEAP